MPTKIKWIKFTESTPNEGQKVSVKFRIHRHGVSSDVQQEPLTFVGMNKVIGLPMFKEYRDDCYIEGISWKPIN